MAREEEQYVFSPFKEENLVFLFDWLRQSHISKWCDAPEDWDQFEKKHKSRLSSDDHSFLVYLSGVPIGYIRYYFTDSIGAGWWGKDKDGVTDTVRVIVLIGRPVYLGRGHGGMIVKSFVKNLFRTPGIKRALIGPHRDNEAAIGCYVKAGFKKLGEHKTPEGPVMLMELKKACYSEI